MKKPATNLLTGMPYNNAARSQQPNYLRERFQEIAKAMKEEKTTRSQPTPIRKKA